MGVLDLFRLDGKVVLVTGASRGLGKEMTVALAEGGADLVIVGRGQDALIVVAEEIRKLGRHCLTIVGDVSMRGEAQRVVDEALSW